VLDRVVPGEKTDPLTVPSEGVEAPDATLEARGREEVEEKRLDSETFERP